MNLQKETPVHSDHQRISSDHPPCILVVEDDHAVADMLEVAFKAWGYKVCIARNGLEGLNFIATQSVDGILLDMHMPVMNGRTMLDELRWAGYQLPVWMMSGRSDVQELRQLLHEGAQGFFHQAVPPPISPTKLCSNLVIGLVSTQKAKAFRMKALCSPPEKQVYEF